jgi:micrococcal nuclease
MRKLLFSIAMLLSLASLLTGCVFQDNVKKLVLSAKESATLQVDYFKVAKVVDGDTIDVDYFGKIERVRMIGINTPESVDPRRPDECLGKAASAEAAKLLTGRYVSLESDKTQDDRDKYGRLLRYVKIKDGAFYNLEIIKKGLAREYTYKAAYHYQKDFKKAQTQAQRDKVGLWADNACGQKTPPKASTSTAIANVSAAAPSNPGLCRIKGNIGRNKKKTYHLPTCPDYVETIINPTVGEKFFCTEAEAIKNGFKKALNCK